MKRKLLVLLILMVLMVWPSGASAAPSTLIPVFYITQVDRDNTVTIQTFNFPAGDTFTVRMNYYGTLGLGGTIVGSQNSGAGGTFSATYPIPAAYHGLDRIAIRLDSPTTGYYSFNWFWNFDHPGVAPTAGPSPTPGPAPTAGPVAGYPPAGPWTIPLFWITNVSRDNTVSIVATNFTTNDNYKVLMNYYGTLGIGGTEVATQPTDGTGAFSATYNIPPGLYGLDRIAIRLQSPTSGYYSFNWFWNFDH